MAGLATPMAIRVAATLDLAEHAEGTGATVEYLAHETGTAPAALRCLLDHLVAVGVFARDADTGTYRPTELGSGLHRDAPDSIKPLLDINTAGGRAELAFVELLETTRTGEPAYPRFYGREFWADLDTNPRLRESFDAQMNWRFREQAPRIAANLDWSRFSRILDVGGGDATLLTAILEHHPEPFGRVLELGPTANAAAERIAAAGLRHRAEAVTGSFFEPLPTEADAYLLCDILHDWDDHHARAILTECRRAAAPDGTVIVIEPIRDQGADTAIDLFMLMCFGGRERTITELTALATESGLRPRCSSEVADGRTALECTVATEH